MPIDIFGRTLGEGIQGMSALCNLANAIVNARQKYGRTYLATRTVLCTAFTAQTATKINCVRIRGASGPAPEVGSHASRVTSQC